MFHVLSGPTRWVASVRSAGVTALVAALTAGASASAWSATSLSFNGQLANASVSQGVSPTTQFDFWGLNLDAFAPFQITAGEDIVATVALDGAYTLPGAPSDRFIRLFFNGPDLAPLNPVQTSGGIELFLGGMSLQQVTGQGCGTSTALAACVVLPAPSTTPLTFDKVVFTFSIDTLNGAMPVTVESAYFDTVVTTPVPEASTWALLSAGLALVGGAVRRRRAALR